MRHRRFPRPSVFVVLGAVAALILIGPANGRTAVAPRNACMGQWLFNGVWRVRVTAVEPLMNGGQQTGWQVTEEWRNGTAQQLYPSQSQLKDQTLELSNGSVNASDTTTGTLSMGAVANNAFPPAGEFRYKQAFYVNNVDPSNKPKAIDIVFDGAKLAQFKSLPQFSTAHYDDRFKLDCTATGKAAEAEGGSTQIDAQSGCMKQWMSNGVWRMRVTAVSPNPPTNPFGWLVTQEWVNITKDPAFPGVLDDMTLKARATNVTDEYLVTQAGVSASSSDVVGGLRLGQRNIPFAPGSSYTFDQLFAWGQFDAADKPVRLLVTFDAKRQDALADHPHYGKTPNFRIDLTCTK